MGLTVAGRSLNHSHVLALGALIAPPLAMYVPLGLSPTFIIVAVLCLGLSWRERPWRSVPRDLAAGLALLLLWAAVSAWWSIEPLLAIKTTFGVAAMTAGGLVLFGYARGLDEAGRRLVRLGLATGLTLALVMAALEIHLGGPVGYLTFDPNPQAIPLVRRLGRGLTIAIILLVPAMVSVWRCGYRRWAVALPVLALLSIPGGENLSSKISLVLVPLVYVTVMRWPRWGARGLAGLAILLVLSFPLLAMAPSPQAVMDQMGKLEKFPNSAHHRYTIWTFTARKAMEHPWRGWGMEASRNIPDGEEGVWVTRHYPLAGPPPLRGEIEIFEQFLPLHPHNGSGQVWLELGGVGAVLVCLVLGLIGRRLSREADPVNAATAAASFVAVLMVASVSYGIWQSWWLGALWLTAVWVSAVGTPGPNR